MMVYGIMPQRHRWKILLAASYLFFYMLSGKLLIYLILSTFSIHHMGLWLSSCKRDFELQKKLIPQEERNALKDAYTKKRRKILLFAVVIHVGMLLFLKYFNFFGANVNHVLELFSVPVQIPQLKLAVPLGISFYTLQAVSYITDIYQGKMEADDNLGRLAIYMSFFPIIMEGPICRYSQTAPALYEGNPLTYRGVTFGYQRIIWGLFKKLVIADRLNPLVKTIFDNHQDYGGIVIIAGAVLYTFQLYADFSGCIDITIGTGEIFGVKVPENFRQPFFSRTASEFWRRWHMTLSGWFKDYVYIPLGGNKVKKSRWIFNIAVVWFLTGLWHGAAWNFIFWGAYFGIILVVEKLFLNRFLDKVPSAVKRVYVLFIILISFIIFNAPSLGTAFTQIGMLFGSGTSGAISQLSFYYFKSYALLMVIAVIGSTPYPRKLAEKLIPEKAKIFIKPIWYGILLIICTAYIVDGSYNPFLYFRF